MIDAVRSQRFARELLQIVILFDGGMVRTDHREPAAARFRLLKLSRDRTQRLGPRDWLQLSVFAQHRRLQALRAMREVKRVTPFDAQKLAIDSRVVAIVPPDDLVVANAQSGLAT